MKLAKVTRKRLREAQGKPIECKWPASAPEALSGHKYPVYGKDGFLFQVRVEAVKRRQSNGETVTHATIVIDADPHRPMVGLQGVRREDGSYESEPERVDAAFEEKRAMEGRAKTGILGQSQRSLGEVRQNGGRLGKEAAARAHRRHEQAVHNVR